MPNQIKASIVAGVVAVVMGVVLLVNGPTGPAVDTAGAQLTVAQAQQMKSEGKVMFITALTWWPSCHAKTTVPWVSEGNLRIAKDNGLRIGGYILLDAQESGADAVDRAYQSIPSDLWNQLDFAAIDFEIPVDGCFDSGIRITRDTVCEALDRLSYYGAPRLLYTSFGEWGSRLSPPGAQGCPSTYLWLANWDNDPTGANFDRHPFGGWQDSDVLIKQFTGDTTVAGIDVDSDQILRPLPWLTTTETTTIPTTLWQCGPDHDAWYPSPLWHFSDGHVYDPALDQHMDVPSC